jgi:hypothetical protein
MKVNNILHIMGAIGCIGGIVGLYSSGWHLWQWPAIALLWVASSYINAWSAYKAEMKLAKANDKIDLAK